MNLVISQSFGVKQEEVRYAVVFVSVFGMW